MFQKIKNMPIGVVGTVLGAATLSNVYNLFGFVWIRHISMILAGLFALIGIIKVLCFFPKVKEEYKNPVFASLYATITMCLMLFITYLIGLGAAGLKPVFLGVVFVHMALIAIFLIYHFILHFNYDTFFPSIFVTLLGLLVSTVSGAGLMPQPMLLGIFVYGICMYLVMLAFMIIRLATKPIPDPAMHTKCILMAPCSLVFVSYLNIGGIKGLESWVSPAFVLALYAFVFLTLLYILQQTVKFFSVPFTPGFAALTFPMAIGTLASWRGAQYFLKIEEYKVLGDAILNITGIQLYITSAFLAIVIFKFALIFADSYKAKAQ